MWVARDEDGTLFLWFNKPKRAINFWHGQQKQDGWSMAEEFVQNKHQIDGNLFPDLTWKDEPIEVVITEKPNLSLDVIRDETPDDTIVLTRYYEDYEEKHEWFINMLKHQERYNNCTDEEREEIWKSHIKEEYTFDEIWNTIQCDGYTKIVLRMGRHDVQPAYDYVLETKEYIDDILKKHGY